MAELLGVLREAHSVMELVTDEQVEIEARLEAALKEAE